MNKNDCMFSLHNTDNTKEILTSAVNAFCDLKTDACMTIDLSFERCVRLNSLHDTYSCVNIEILKAEDYRVPNNNLGKWNDEDQVWISNNGKNGRNGGGTRRKTRKTNMDIGTDSTNTSSTKLEYKSSEYVAKYISPKPEIDKKVAKKHKARLWELPSGEVYAVRITEAPKRKVNFRKSRSATDVKTAQEMPAVRERGNASDVTDNDSTLLKTDTLSRESVADETNPKSPRNPRASVETVEEPKKEESMRKVKEEPKFVQEESLWRHIKDKKEEPKEPNLDSKSVQTQESIRKSVETKSCQTQDTKQESIRKTMDSKSVQTQETKPESIRKAVESKSVQTTVPKESKYVQEESLWKNVKDKPEEPKPKPVEEPKPTKQFEDKAVNTSPRCSPPEPFVPSIRRRADAGHLQVVETINGVTKFQCSVRHLYRRTKASRKKEKKSRNN